MVRTAVAFAFLSVTWGGSLGLSREPGCGGADSPSGGVNAPCTRSKDCSASLVCAQGVCAELDSGTSGMVSTPDGGPDATSSGDATDDGG